MENWGRFLFLIFFRSFDPGIGRYQHRRCGRCLPGDSPAAAEQKGASLRSKDAGHLERGYFTLSLYAEDLYNRETIENLKQGDRILVQGETYTVGYIRIHGWYDSDGDGETDESGTYAKHPAQELADSRELVDDGDFNEAPDSFEISAYELIMLEDFPGYIVFEPVSDTECRSVVNDWSP